MRKKLLIFSLPLLLLATLLNAQDGYKVFEKVEVNATTDQQQLTNHILRKSQLPDSILKTIPAGSYKVNVQFVIDVHGIMGQVKAKNDPGFGLAQRAVQIMSTYKGKWQPANQCGRNVKAYREQLITFIIEGQ